MGTAPLQVEEVSIWHQLLRGWQGEEDQKPQLVTHVPSHPKNVEQITQKPSAGRSLGGAQPLIQEGWGLRPGGQKPISF